MQKTGILGLVVIVMVASMSFFAEAAENQGDEGTVFESYQLSNKQEEGVEVDVRLCGCRVISQSSGALTGKVCGCTVVDLSKGDFFVVATAMLGLVVLSGRKK